MRPRIFMIFLVFCLVFSYFPSCSDVTDSAQVDTVDGGLSEKTILYTKSGTDEDTYFSIEKGVTVTDARFYIEGLAVGVDAPRHLYLEDFRAGIGPGRRLLAALKGAQPGFSFANRITVATREVTLRNDCGLDLGYRGTQINVGLTIGL